MIMHDIGEPGGSVAIPNLRQVPAIRIDASDGAYFVYGVTQIRDELARLEMANEPETLKTGWTTVTEHDAPLHRME